MVFALEYSRRYYFLPIIIIIIYDYNRTFEGILFVQISLQSQLKILSYWSQNWKSDWRFIVIRENKLSNILYNIQQ